MSDTYMQISSFNIEFIGKQLGGQSKGSVFGGLSLEFVQTWSVGV